MFKILAASLAILAPTITHADETTEYAKLYHMGYIYSIANFCDFAPDYIDYVENYKMDRRELNTFLEGANQMDQLINETTDYQALCVEGYELYWEIAVN